MLKNLVRSLQVFLSLKTTLLISSSDYGFFRKSCIEFFRNINQRSEKIAFLMSAGFYIGYL
jgi:hypothetical protein